MGFERFKKHYMIDNQFFMLKMVRFWPVADLT